MVWYQKYGWDSNPFELKPMPDLVSGLEDIRSELLEFIKSGDCCLLIGPNGSGKTTLLKWLEKYALAEGIPLYINTSGMNREDVEQLNIDSLIREKAGLLGMLLKKKGIIMLVDEAQDLPQIVGKSIERNFDEHNIKSVVLASTIDDPESLRKSLLERVGKRKVIMRPMTHDEAFSMIVKRVGFRNPFELGSLDIIFRKAGYVPRKILEFCETLAMESSEATVTRDFVISYFARETAKEEVKSNMEDLLDRLSPLQRKIVNTLRTGNFRPKEIAVKLGKPTKTITSQLAYLGLKSRIDVMRRKGIEKPLVEKETEKPAVYKLSDEIKRILDNQ